MTVEQCIDKVVAVAEAEVGYLEKKSNSNLDSKTGNAGSNNYTKYARDMDKTNLYNGAKNGYSWCDIFTDWVFTQAFGFQNMLKITNQPTGGCGAGCPYSAQYYRNMGRFYTKPKRGDQIFFKDSSGEMCHTGIVVGVDSKYVYTIEGNTSNASGVVANGGGVAKKSYSLGYNRIGGYGRPKYEIIEDMEDDDMTLERFKELMSEYRGGLQDNDAAKWSKEARNWAVETGMISGDSNGEFNGMWEDFLTREQMATILYRFAKYIGKA